MEKSPTPPSRRTIWRTLKKVTILVGLLILVAAAISAINNQRLPTHSRRLDRLDARQQLLLAESLQLKRALGNSVWPGWGDAPIPVLLYNEQYGFLTGGGEAPNGWEPVVGESILNAPYYRLAGSKRQAFAVRVGSHWAGSMATKEWMQISMVEDLRRKLPPGVKTVFPYPIVLRVLDLHSSELHIATVLHENFHAFQAESAPEMFTAALAAYAIEKRYPWSDPSVRSAWATEIDLLAQALDAKSHEQTMALARRFVAQRRARRQHPAFDDAIVAYERRMEWLEGMAKYVELGVWREASASASYKSLPQLAADQEFKNYSGFSTRWSKELLNMKMQLSKEGDLRFYYTGMAQACVLDRLKPDWKARVFKEDIGLEELLAEAVAGR